MSGAAADAEAPGPEGRHASADRPGPTKPPLRLRSSERLVGALNLIPLPTREVEISDTVLLTGTSRSGTSWVARLLSASPELCLVTEPLNLKMPGVARAGFTWDTYVEPDADWPEGEALLRRCFRGRGLALKLLHRNGWRAFTCDGLVVKSIRANRLLPWIARRFDLRGIVHLVRHPCAVVSSQMKAFGVRDPTWPDNLDYLRRELPHLLPMAERLSREEEFRALKWAIDQHVPFSVQEPRPFTTVAYEHLVAEGAKELERVFGSLGMSVPEEAASRLAADSWQAREHSVDHGAASVEERLGIWRERLSPDQVDRILAVTEACGIVGYGRDLMPTSELGMVRSGGAGP